MDIPVTKVCETNVSLTQLKKLDVYKIFKKLHKGVSYQGLSAEDKKLLHEVFDESWNEQTFHTGVHFVLGWELDFRPFLKQFEVTFLNQFYTKETKIIYGFNARQILDCATTKVNKNEKGILAYTATGS